MKRIIPVLISLLLAAGVLSCITPPGPVESIDEEGGSSVWKVTKDGNTLYLAGSVHVLREEDFPLPLEFHYAFSQSKVLVLETDTAEIADPKNMEFLMNNLILPEGETLRSILDPEVYQLLADTCLEYGFSIDPFYNYKPSMVVNIITMVQVMFYGFVQEGVDDFYLAKAVNSLMPVKFLEPIQAQIEMILLMGEGYENEYVLYSLTDMENTAEMLEVIVYEWRNGAEEATTEMVVNMKEDWPQMYKSLITDRHDLWIPQIIEFIASGQVHFVIAGLAHMYGPDGLLNILKNLGYTIEKVKLE
ncbi:MAG: TraB/GumN family protein [Treponema sp.]|nr:TraB/GumN family protein [Treponema sp.]